MMHNQIKRFHRHELHHLKHWRNCSSIKPTFLCATRARKAFLNAILIKLTSANQDCFSLVRPRSARKRNNQINMLSSSLHAKCSNALQQRCHTLLMQTTPGDALITGPCSSSQPSTDSINRPGPFNAPQHPCSPTSIHPSFPHQHGALA